MMKKNSLLILGIIVLLLLSTSMTVSASSASNIGRNQWTGNATINEDGTMDVGLPDKNLEDVEIWIDKKGGDVISLLQALAQPFMLAVMIIGVFMTVAGGKKARAGGIFMVIFSGIGLAGILFAPEVMDIFITWIAS